MCAFAPLGIVRDIACALDSRSNTLCESSYGFEMHLSKGIPHEEHRVTWEFIVIKKSASTLATIAILLAFISQSTNAQQNTESCTLYNQLVERHGFSCLFNWTFDDLPDPNAPPTMVCCNPLGVPWGQVCAAPRPSCGVPPGAAPETCLSCNQGKTPQAAQPIDLATGNTYIAQSDLSIPGLGGGLSLS